MDSWLLIDCAQRTTAVLVEATDGGYRLIARGTARTTLDPEGDVALGVCVAVRQLEETTGKILLHPEEGRGIVSPRDGRGNGVDQVLITSSVGGGLQMMVAGVVRIMTAESAERAALGAGASVLDVIAVDDGRMPHERIERMRELRPDLFLFSGGVNNGNLGNVLAFAREIAQADLPEMPIVYAGNLAARRAVLETLGKAAEVHLVDNLRPQLEQEVLEPTREKIHELFMRHVVSQAPGFERLGAWAARPVMPSSGAVSKLIELLADRGEQDVLAVMVGDSTTDVFSVFAGRFTRSVSADLGLGYSIANVAVKAGRPQLTRWLPFELDRDELMDRLRNKMLKAAGPPDDGRDLAIQQAVAREAMRLALAQHTHRATRLRGVHQKRDIADLFARPAADTLVDMNKVQLIIAAAGVFSWADDQANARVLLDALQPKGVTRLAIDQFVVSPHLGMLASVDAAAARQVYLNDGLRHLGVSVCPMGRLPVGKPCLHVTIDNPGETTAAHQIAGGQVVFLPAVEGSAVTVRPWAGLDIGAGRGRCRTVTMSANACGLIIDTRGRGQA